MGSDLEHELDEAIGVLYDVFSEYPLRPVLDSCPCCHQPEDEAALRRRPLRELAGEDLRPYAWDALLTWGDTDDLRHFLPRLLELAARTDFPDDLEVLFGKLTLAAWRQWPTPEQAAVDAYLRALWRAQLDRQSAPQDTGAVLCAVAQAVDELRPFLQTWRTPPRERALLHLAQFLEANAHSLFTRSRLVDEWWRDRPEQERQVVRWLTERTTRAALEVAFFTASSAAVATELSSAERLLATERRVVPSGDTSSG